MNDVTLVSIMKNEGDAPLEWVAFHRAVGISSFRIYDNGSAGVSSDVLRRLGRTVEVIDWSSPDKGASPQIAAYNHALRDLRGGTKWLGFIDADEFLVPSKLDTIQECISAVEVLSPPDSAAIGANWKTFGSSGHKIKTPGLVIERFTRCAAGAARPNSCIKTLAKSDCIESAHIHFCKLQAGIYVNVSGVPITIRDNGMSDAVSHEVFSVHHYMVKSRMEYEIKRTRGNANLPNGHPQKLNRFDEKYWTDFDINTVEDRAATRFLERTKAELEHLERAN
jgi:hypothetical protein